MHNDHLDDLLRMRRMPQAPAYLAAQIIAAADARRPASLWQRLQAGIFEMMAVPHPGMAAAFTVIIGLIAGIEISAGLDGSSQDLAALLYLDEGNLL